METLDTEWEVLTDEGWSDFSGLKVSSSNDILELKTQSKTLICTAGHKVYSNSSWIEVQKLNISDLILTDIGYELVIAITPIEGERTVYDLVGVDKGSKYITGGIISHNCDEFAHLKPNLAEEFTASVFPTISSAKTSKLVLISTPNGLNHFHKLWVEAEAGTNGFVTVEGNWREHPGRDQVWAEEQKKKLGEIKYMQEIECSFVGSSYTLIDGTKLSTLPIAQPKFIKEGLEIYHEPEPSHVYVCTVDTSRGRHKDYSAFVIIDVTTTPYKVCATYKNNEISTLEYPHMIFNTCRQFNNAYILIEINDLGQEVSNILWHDYEYENMYFTKGDLMTSVSGYPGVRTTKSVKGLGCSVLKDLIEKDQIELNSHKIVEELSLFVMAKRGSYESSDTKVNDDLTTCMWLFAWLTKQGLFEDLTNSDVRKLLAKQKDEYINASLTPFGFYNEGLTNPESIKEHFAGDIWEVVN